LNGDGRTAPAAVNRSPFPIFVDGERILSERAVEEIHRQ
jgi:hypothetical protein